MMVILPTGHTLIDRKHFTGCYTVDWQPDIYHCLIGSFSPCLNESSTPTFPSVFWRAFFLLVTPNFLATFFWPIYLSAIEGLHYQWGTFTPEWGDLRRGRNQKFRWCFFSPSLSFLVPFSRPFPSFLSFSPRHKVVCLNPARGYGSSISSSNISRIFVSLQSVKRARWL